MKHVPTADATGKWIKRHGLMGVYGVESINKVLLKRYLVTPEKPIKQPLLGIL
jgi:hypothetical protein